MTVDRQPTGYRWQRSFPFPRLELAGLQSSVFAFRWFLHLHGETIIRRGCPERVVLFKPFRLRVPVAR